MKMIYGIEIAPKDDRYVEIAEQALDGVVTAATPGAFFVDIFPWCKYGSEARRCQTDQHMAVKYLPEWMPGAGFKKKATWKESVFEMRDAPFEAVQKALVSVYWSIER
jgi:hypothetical protein